MVTTTWVKMREVTKDDIQQIVTIERQSFGRDSWSSKDFSVGLFHDVTCFGEVAVTGKEVLGYVIFTPADDYISIDNMAISPKYRRNGIASLFVDRLMSHLNKVDKRGASRKRPITALIHERNVTAQLFLKANGFLVNGVISDGTSIDRLYHFVLQLDPWTA